MFGKRGQILKDDLLNIVCRIYSSLVIGKLILKLIKNTPLNWQAR